MHYIMRLPDFDVIVNVFLVPAYAFALSDLSFSSVYTAVAPDSILHPKNSSVA